jgi:hypothetical protein
MPYFLSDFSAVLPRTIPLKDAPHILKKTAKNAKKTAK